MISIRKVLKNSLKWNVLSMFCLFLFITVVVQGDDFYNLPPIEAKYNVSSYACAGFTQAQASVSVSISNVGYFRGTLGRYGGYARGQVGNQSPTGNQEIGIEIYRKTGSSIGGSIKGTGGSIGGGGGQLATRDERGFSINDWRIPTSHNSASCEGWVDDWNSSRISAPSRSANYNGSVNLTTAGNGNTWVAATCDPSY